MDKFWEVRDMISEWKKNMSEFFLYHKLSVLTSPYQYGVMCRLRLDGCLLQGSPIPLVMNSIQLVAAQVVFYLTWILLK